MALLLCAAIVLCGLVIPHVAAYDLEDTDSLTPIMGTSCVTVSQMVDYYNQRATYPSFYANTDAPTLRDFCLLYLEECAAEGVRAEIAFCQAMNETGYLRYGGLVKIEQFNFAGLGAVDLSNGSSVAVFSSVREGIRAHVQHLKGYASTEALINACVDPRFIYVKRGSAPYVEWLGIQENPHGIGWATISMYGVNILNNFLTKLLPPESYSVTWYYDSQTQSWENYAAVYNYDYYITNNPDIIQVLGTDDEVILKHFVAYGMQEGRRASANFNVTYYQENYSDLQAAFQENLPKYYLHYINYGKQENRVAAEVSVPKPVYSVTHVVQLRKLILEGISSEEYLALFDLNLDGSLTVADVVLLRNIILSQT